MALTCSKCARVNPADATYCYFDGFVLNGHGTAVPSAAGKRNFPTEFVFPSGRTCRNFDELATACQENWKEACNLLDEGLLERFLSGLGRADLTLAAREAARFPDRERGLDQLLVALPTDVLAEPKLQVEPQEINLGTLAVGEERKFSLQFENLGMRLLYGTIAVEDCPWLALGEGTGAPQRVFQFGAELALAVHIRGQRLRASNKPLEGRLVVESNGGNFMIAVRAEVPVKPFAEGVLAGAVSPRQVAEKALKKPKEAAPFFEKGLVASWYKDNGWAYPVRVPSSSGLGAVQQFFEALGLTPPPKVEISEREVRLEAKPGAALRHKLEVRTQEKRPVWAHAASDQPWLEVSRAKLNGRTATIGFSIPSVPDRPGEELLARVTVTANGNQRFVVPVRLLVGGAFAFTTAVATPAEVVPAPLALGSVLLPSAAVPMRQAQRVAPWVHVLPMMLLVLILLGMLIRDSGQLFSRTKELGRVPDSTGRTTPPPPPILTEDEQWFTNLVDKRDYVSIAFSKETCRFGVFALDANDATKHKKLTSGIQGANNNTIVRINRHDYIFGRTIKDVCKVISQKGPEANPKDGKEHPKKWVTVWEAYGAGFDTVRVTQTAMIVPGETQTLNTCLVRYRVENKTNFSVNIGLRVMLDTFIGDKDGVPFSVPGGDPPLVTTKAVLEKDRMPDYVQALENGDLEHPGTIAHLGLRGIRLANVDLEPVDRIVICRWPDEEGKGEARWAWDYKPIDLDPENKDSCVVIYWADVPMNADEPREMAFTYGLGAISPTVGDSKGQQMTMSAPRAVRPGDSLTVVAYVSNPKPNEPARLSLPDGLTWADDKQREEMTIKMGPDYGTASWRVKAVKAGKYTLETQHADLKVSQPLSVSEKKNTFLD